MITLNLLPDIKKEYMKAKRTKRLFVTIALFVSAGSIAAVVLMAMYVLGVQTLQVSNSQGSIDDSIATLTGTEDLDKMVTVQNQLDALPPLHQGTVVASRLFDDLIVLVPNEVSLNSIAIDYTKYTIEMKGQGSDFKSVNTFVDTLKNASFVYDDNDQSALAFSSVVLGSIGKSDDSTSFKITLVFDPLIFDTNITGLKLSVPNITSTRSQTEKPKSLFDAEEVEEE